MLENGLESCPCPKRNCARHGDCAACIAYHAQKNSPPRCKRKKGFLPFRKK